MKEIRLPSASEPVITPDGPIEDSGASMEASPQALQNGTIRCFAVDEVDPRNSGTIDQEYDLGGESG
jgi:hypothetical protein